MALVDRHRFEDDWIRNRDSFFGRHGSMWDSDWNDWPLDWPRPKELISRLSRHLDRMDSNWREHPFWREQYPSWAEPVFKEGIDVRSNIINDSDRFAVEIDCNQFKPEEIQVKMQGDTLLVEGKHEDVRDRDNYTKMYFVRKYQLPRDVDPQAIQSNIDNSRRLTVEAPKRQSTLGYHDRRIPIEDTSKSRASSRTRHDSGYSNGPSPVPPRGPTSPIDVHIPYNDEAREREWQDRNRSNENGSSYSASRYFRRSESRSSNIAPHQVTSNNENRAYSPRRPAYDYRDDRDNVEPEQMSPGRGIFNTIRDKFEKGFRSGSRESRSASRNSHRDYDNGGYRVETPVSIPVQRERDASRGYGNESRAESMRSVRIERKTFG